VLLPLGKLFGDPPEKWTTIRSALDDDAKARRLGRLVLITSIPTLVIVLIVVGAAVLLALL
jgi:hypothetical protein